MKRFLPVIILGVILLSLLGLGLLRHFKEKTIFNDSYVNGNTAGNLYNAGLFCENNGIVYFANPDDMGKLYSMTPDGQNVTKISNDIAMYINADDNYIYYVRNNTKNAQGSSTAGPAFPYFSYNNNSLCRINKDGNNCIILDEDPCIYASLLGNYIYYLHYDNETATTLYKIKIDGSERQQISDTYAFTCSTDGANFYYNGMQTNGNIYRFDTTTDTSYPVYVCNSYKPIVIGGQEAFYLDVDKDNALMHASFNSDTPVVITDDSIDLYNLYGDRVFYQSYSSKGNELCTIKTDGSEAMMLASSAYSCINTTSLRTYFTDYRTGQIFYTSTQNPGALLPFHPGIIK